MTLFIKCSSLPAWADCSRRWAAHNLKPVSDYCATEGEYKQNVAAVIGTICHEAARKMLIQKFEIGCQPDWENPLRLAIQEFHEAIKNPTRWDDDITRDRVSALIQIEKLIKQFVVDYLYYAVPAYVETDMAMSLLGEKIILTGRPDIIQAGSRLDDLKFGTRLAGYQGQFGGYMIILQATTGEIIKECNVAHFKRVGASKPQPEMHAEPLNPEECFDTAKFATETILKQLQLWDDRVRDNHPKRLWAFPTNSNSKLCTQTACKAFGTPACDQWRRKTA